jgi:signal transduction histidine kinase
LLLNSPAGVKLLALPPFWTLARLSAVLSVLTVIIILVLIWIYQLKKEVRHQVHLLEREILKKEQVERAHAIEQERSRIARDLHDDLGSNLTAINMLADINARKINSSEPAGQLLRLIAERSRSLVTSLDQMVWTVNPKNDNLGALMEYLASYAEEFLGRVEVSCKMEMRVDAREHMVPAKVRHNILLATAEILNNAVRHGKPSQVALRLTASANLLEISVQDDGIGFDADRQTSGNGLNNLQERMRLVNGHCRIKSSPGTGTLVCLTISL